MQPLRVAIVSDDPLTRSGLAALLSHREEVAVVGTPSPQDLEGLRALGVEGILFDLASGQEALGALAAAFPLVALADGEEQAARALRGGARGVVLRDASADKLAAALTSVVHGLIALDRPLSGWVQPAAAGAVGEGLTPREMEVLSLLAEGLPNKVIAQRLGTSERTAKFHVESILGKLGAENRSEAIVLAARRGLVVL
ncbi:MAG TPA: response regulator transcription factor [Anaeromyxobacteraceae bacterium]|nr:response regulator transcription factor [Anaeromyxobacteraceae bacterium]